MAIVISLASQLSRAIISFRLLAPSLIEVMAAAAEASILLFPTNVVFEQRLHIMEWRLSSGFCVLPLDSHLRSWHKTSLATSEPMLSQWGKYGSGDQKWRLWCIYLQTLEHVTYFHRPIYKIIVNIWIFHPRPHSRVILPGVSSVLIWTIIRPNMMEVSHNHETMIQILTF